MTRDEYVASLKKAAISIGKQAVMSRLVAKLPGLLLGTAGKIFNPLVSFVVERILVYAIEEGEMGAFFLYVDLRVEVQAVDFEKAAVEHFKAVQGESPEEIKRAEDKLKKAFRAFVVLTN